MIENFKILEKCKKEIGNGGLICMYPEIIPLNEKIKSYRFLVCSNLTTEMGNCNIFTNSKEGDYK